MNREQIPARKLTPGTVFYRHGAAWTVDETRVGSETVVVTAIAHSTGIPTFYSFEVESVVTVDGDTRFESAPADPAPVPATRHRIPARDVQPGHVMRFMARPVQVIAASNVWTRGNHSYVTLTFLESGEVEHEEFFADSLRHILNP